MGAHMIDYLCMFSLPDLTYDFSALEPHIDTKTMELHHDKHHATYIKNLNDALSDQEELLSLDINQLLQNLDRVPDSIRTKVRNNGGGHANHSLFWTVMTPLKDSHPDSTLSQKITDSFGDMNTLKDQFTQAALSVFGSGWAWIVVEHSQLSIQTTPNQDTPVMNGVTPILGLDVWEHAYYLQYQNRRPEYIDAWWNVVNWDEVSKRLVDAH